MPEPDAGQAPGFAFSLSGKSEPELEEALVKVLLRSD